MSESGKNTYTEPENGTRKPDRAKIFYYVVLVLSVIFLFSGVRIIQPGEVGVILRFGRLPSGARTHPPGLVIAMPHPINEVIRVSVEAIRQVTIDDYWQPEVSGSTLDSFHPFEQSYCLTGDFNILVPKLTVKYQVKDAVAYALYIENPDQLLKDVVGAEMVRTIGEMGIDYLLTEGKSDLALTVMTRSQALLDSVESGLHVVSIEITEFIPPRSILPDFQDVQSASIEKETAIRTAETYREEQLPLARADANLMVSEAETYSVRVLAQANSDANRFNTIYEEYIQNPEVVRERLRNEYFARALVLVGRRYVAPGPPVSGRILIPPAYGQ